MNPRFLRPNVVWSGIWFAIFVLIFSIGFWQSKLYWKNSFEQVQQTEFDLLQALLPYTLAFLEEHGQTGLIRQILNLEEKHFTLVYTDLKGALKHPDSFTGSPPADLTYLNNYKFTYVYQVPQGIQGGAPSQSAAGGAVAAPVSPSGAGAYGKLYFIAKGWPALQEAIWDKHYFRDIWPGESFFGFTVMSYLLVMVGFAAICSITAKYQSHFQSTLEEQHRSELETRDLHIQVLESNLKTLDLRLQILDQDYEKALTTSNKAKKAIDRLVKKLQSESTKNEELEENLSKAQLEHKSALAAVRAIRQDKERVAAEKEALESLRQEQQEYGGQAGHFRVKPKEYLWLNLVYKNLSFSKRALQNIIDLQYVHDLFPSLPDALASLNSNTVDSLISGAGLPPRSVVRYTQQLENFKGYLWEYRFSRDGRIFFGLSQSRIWSIDAILLKRHFSDNRYKYEKYLENTLGKDNTDLKPELDQ